MGSPVTRIGDSVDAVCSSHGPTTGHFTQGVSDIFANGIQVCLVGHEGDLLCGHGFRATSGSSVYDVDGIPVVRIGDSIEVIRGATGIGTVTGGSPTVDSN